VPEAPPPAAAPGPVAPAEVARPIRLRPVEPSERSAAVQQRRAAGEEGARPHEVDAAAAGADVATRASRPASLGDAPIGAGSAAFLAQLIGQMGPAEDPVTGGRGPLSFRRSPVERYEEVHAWARRVELFAAFEGTFAIAAAA
jgi:hypothetical protein